MAIKNTIKVLGAAVALAIAVRFRRPIPKVTAMAGIAYYKSEISASEAYL
jgi:hypothetical protein